MENEKNANIESYWIKRKISEPTEKEQIEILAKFAKNLTENQKDLEPEYAKLISDNLWDLAKQ